MIVTGKADVRNGRVSVVADVAQDYVEGMQVLEDTCSVAYRFRNGGDFSGRPDRARGAVRAEQTAHRLAQPLKSARPPVMRRPSRRLTTGTRKLAKLF